MLLLGVYEYFGLALGYLMGPNEVNSSLLGTTGFALAGYGISGLLLLMSF